MTRNKGIKRIIASAFAMLLSTAMLLGSTYAYFTDSTSSSNNIIASGNLKVNAYWMEGTKNPETDTWTNFTNGAIFDNDKWEPGYVEAKHLKIENAGNLAFKYKLLIVPNGEYSTLADVIDVYYFADATTLSARSDVSNGTLVGTLKDLIEDEDGAAYGALLPEGATVINPSLEKSGSVVVTIALKMRENLGSEYEGLSIGTDFNVNVVASQYAYESDSFGSDYDLDAEYPEITSSYFSSGLNAPLTLKTKNVSVTIPVGAEDGLYSLEVTNRTVTENAVSTDITLLSDGEKVSPADYTVKVQIEKMKDIQSVKHNGEEIQGYTYDADGVVTFTTQSFSTFTITYKDIDAEGVKLNENNQIVAGTFKGKNPADIDPTLKEENSEYIAINYEQEINGETTTCYVVAERATTVVVSPSTSSTYSNEEDTKENGNYTVQKESSGKLWSIISGLQNNDFSTVYLLPGTYEEATTIGVYSNMDIVGLGNKEDIIVKKVGVHTTKNKVSNQHLFNVSGTKADYIQVTIKNMTLDATEKNSYISDKGFFKGKQVFEDNAAVQSIRKSKAKCYDLNIIKGTSSPAVAFYVNGNNAVDGVKYTAYLYAENCKLNASTTGNVVTTSGSYKFYYSNLTYKHNGNFDDIDTGTEYTTNSGSIKNQVLASNDWAW